MGIVHEVGVARLHLGGPDLANGQRHNRVHRNQVGRLRERLGDRAQLRVEESTGEVRPRLDVRRIGGAANCDSHLLGHVHQGVADDLERNRVERHLRLFSVCKHVLLHVGPRHPATVRSRSDRSHKLEDPARIRDK